jgi:alpha-beta hydrolase superfamily lysophospholipase
MRLNFIPITIFVLACGGNTLGDDANKTALRFSIEKVRNDLKPLSFTQPDAYPVSIKEYFCYYGLNFDSCRHIFGTFNTISHVLAANIFIPAHSRGTAIILHGYYDHSGIVRNLIDCCIREGLCVAAFDLPGHGLSSGEPAAIDSFSQYANALDTFLTICQTYLPGPFFAVGHSTGCAVVLEQIFRRQDNPYRHIILLAPLVRSEYWFWSKVGYELSKLFTTKTCRWYRNASSDKAFLKWFRRDPLQTSHFPICWAKAMYAWNDRFNTYTPRSVPLTIIQGESDNTVDWRFNIPYLNAKIPGCRIVFIKNGRHQLLNEAEPYRSICLENIREILQTDLH